MKKTREQVLEEFKKSDCPRVKVAVTDIDGVLRGKYLHRDKFLSAVDSGFGFCDVVLGWDSADVCYDNSSYTGWHTGYPDAIASLDLSTARKVPWDNNIPFFLGDFCTSEGNPLDICPRQLLKKVIAKAEKMGFKAFFGMEFEWFNFKETPHTLAEKLYTAPVPLTPGMFGYSILRSSLNQPFFNALLTEMEAFGIPIEGLHTETGPGVYEAAILFSDALEQADRGVLFKTAAKEIGYRFGILPSFMAKWNSQLPGCSGHLHQSLWNIAGDTNLFYDKNDPLKMSALQKSYLAGLLHCLPDVLPFYAPTVNSYKRLVDGYWAPTKVAWGVDNRTTAFRVIPANPKSTRIEARVPGSDVNPYLGIAACLASGLYGIENKLELTSLPIKGSAYLDTTAPLLPRNLQEAALRLLESKTARTLFGEPFVDHFGCTRIWEWQQFQKAVTNWEMQRYFEII
jgi:glutamine synthetase